MRKIPNPRAKSKAEQQLSLVFERADDAYRRCSSCGSDGSCTCDWVFKLVSGRFALDCGRR